MPKKIRELKKELRQVGWYLLTGGGKGSHMKWRHPLAPHSITLSGNDGADAKPRQEKDVAEGVRQATAAQRYAAI